MSRGYDIFKQLRYGYFTWIGHGLTRRDAFNKVERLNAEGEDGCAYFAVPKALPSLLVICPGPIGRGRLEAYLEEFAVPAEPRKPKASKLFEASHAFRPLPVMGLCETSA